MNETHIVYIKLNDNGYIYCVNSSDFLEDLTGWTKIDEGSGDKYHHAQGNYFPLSIITDGGAYRYKIEGGAAVECTPEEITEQEEKNNPAAEHTTDDVLNVLLGVTE